MEFVYICLIAATVCVSGLWVGKIAGPLAMKTFFLLTCTVLFTSVVIGACAYRAGTACGAIDAAMPLQKCLGNPRG